MPSSVTASLLADAEAMEAAIKTSVRLGCLRRLQALDALAGYEAYSKSLPRQVMRRVADRTRSAASKVATLQLAP